MKRIERYRSGRVFESSRARRRSLGLLATIMIGLAAPACEYPVLPGYHCDETNNCADVPTTICRPEYNVCVCESNKLVYCPEFVACVPLAQCFPDAGPVCDAGSGEGGHGGGVGSGGSAPPLGSLRGRSSVLTLYGSSARVSDLPATHFSL